MIIEVLMRACLLLLVSTLTAQTIVVSPSGPVKTLAEARDAARAQRRAGTAGNLTIRISDGVYYLSDTLVLTPEDSNTTWEAAPGARPLISGGRVISDWKKGQGPRWTADAAGSEFRQLFISGRRAQRARTPNFGFYRIDGPSPQDKPLQLHYRGADIKKQWEGGDVEVIAMFAWADIRMPIVKVDEEARVATLTLDPRPSNKEVDARYFIENAPDALDMAGEWYLDRKTHTVTYWPVAGENMASEQVDRAGARATGAPRRQAGSGRVRPQRDFPRLTVCARRLEHGPERLRRYAGRGAGPGRHRGHRRRGMQTGALYGGAFRRLRDLLRARQQTQPGGRLANCSISAAVASSSASLGNRPSTIYRTMRT